MMLLVHMSTQEQTNFLENSGLVVCYNQVYTLLLSINLWSSQPIFDVWLIVVPFFVNQRLQSTWFNFMTIIIHHVTSREACRILCNLIEEDQPSHAPLVALWTRIKEVLILGIQSRTWGNGHSGWSFDHAKSCHRDLWLKGLLVVHMAIKPFITTVPGHHPHGNIPIINWQLSPEHYFRQWSYKALKSWDLTLNNIDMQWKCRILWDAGQASLWSQRGLAAMLVQGHLRKMKFWLFSLWRGSSGGWPDGCWAEWETRLVELLALRLNFKKTKTKIAY